MKIVSIVGVCGLIGGGVYVHGPFGDHGELYARPAAEALSLVETVQLPGRVEGMLMEAGAGDNPIQRALVPGKSVIFTFRVKGQDVATYTVTATPQDAGHAQVATDFAMAPGAEQAMKGEYMPMAKQFSIVGKAMLNESVDAALDGRPYDRGPELAAMQVYAMTNIGEIQKGASDAMNKAAAQFAEADRTAAELQSSLPATADATPFVPGKPMLNPNPSSGR